MSPTFQRHYDIIIDGVTCAGNENILYLNVCRIHEVKFGNRSRRVWQMEGGFYPNISMHQFEVIGNAISIPPRTHRDIVYFYLMFCKNNSYITFTSPFFLFTYPVRFLAVEIVGVLQNWKRFFTVIRCKGCGHRRMPGSRWQSVFRNLWHVS